MAFRVIQLDPLGPKPKIEKCGWRIAHEKKIKNVLVIQLVDEVLSKTCFNRGDDVLLNYDEENKLFEISLSGSMEKNSRRIVMQGGSPRCTIKVIRSSYKGELTEIFDEKGGVLEPVELSAWSMVFKMIPNKE